MATETEVYKVEFNTREALDSLKGLESRLKSLDGKARGLFKSGEGARVAQSVKGIGGAAKTAEAGVSGIDGALSRTSAAALALRAKFEKAQAAMARATDGTTKRQKKQRDSTVKLTDAGKNLDAMMRKFSRNASSGQKKVATAIERTRRAVEKTDISLKQTDKSARRASKGMRQFGGSAGFANQSLAGLITRLSVFIGAAASIRDVVEQYGEFDQAATSAAAKFSKLEPALKPGTDEFARFKKEIREARKETEHSAEGAARAVDFWAKAGKTSEQSKAVLKTTLDFASANQDAEGSMLDVARAGDILSDALGQFGLNADDSATLMANAARVSDTMTAAANSANVSAEELFESFKGAGPVLTAVGSDIEETSALLAAMANAGIKGANAGTQLKMAISNLSALTGPQEKALAKLGVSVKDADGNFKGLTVVIRELNEATKGMGTADRLQVFAKAVGRRAIPSFVNLLAEGQENLDAMADSLRGAGGETQRLAETMRSSGKAQVASFKNDLRDLGFEIIEKTGILGKLKDGIKSIDWDAALKVVTDDVIPALKTFGGVVVNTIVPALRRAGKTVSTILTPALEIISYWFGQLSEKGNTAAKVLGDLITLWVAYRGYLLATKAVGIIGWFVDLTRKMGAATVAQGALNTSTAATNLTLGQSIKSFGLLKSAMGALTAFVIGWEIGTIIREKLVDPVLEARQEFELLQEQFEKNKEDARKGDRRKETFGAMTDDLETAKEAQAHWRAELAKSKDLGFFGQGWVPHETDQLEKATAEVDRLEKALKLKRFEPTADVWTGRGVAGPAMSAPAEFVGADEWDIGGTSKDISSVVDDAFTREVTKKQLAIQEQRALADAEYQKQSLALLEKQEGGRVWQPKIEVGDTTLNIQTKGTDPESIGAEVKKILRERDREQLQDWLDASKNVAAAEI